MVSLVDLLEGRLVPEAYEAYELGVSGSPQAIG
jgi:hypothetical protein